MMTDRKVYPPGAGDVTLQIGSNTLVLRPTLPAGLAISRTAGGIRGAIDKVVALDFDTILSVIRVGIGVKEAKNYPKLDEMIYENGLLDSEGAITAKLVEYLTNLARGGRPADAEDDEKEDREPLSP
jgi:hypothetical protein